MSLHPEQQRAVEYLAKKGTLATTEKLRDQLRDAFAAIERAFDEVAVEKRQASPAEGKWSPHEILDHLVLSHGPALPQLASLLDGVSPPGVAIPADLHRDAGERPAWDESRTQLGDIHREFLQLLESASDDLSLEPKAVAEIVIKVDGDPKHWYERLDWKAFVQTIRVHTIEHQRQLQRASSVNAVG